MADADPVIPEEDEKVNRLPKYVFTGIFRWIFNRPCREEFCDERRRCWRWHVEYWTCPTCHHDVSEFDPNVEDVMWANYQSHMNQYEVNNTQCWIWDVLTGSFERTAFNGV